MLIVAAGLVSVSYFFILHLQFARDNKFDPTDFQTHRFKAQTIYRSSEAVNEVTKYAPASTTRFHIVFSTGCSAFQDWQSYAFFYHILTSGQTGNVTRVASGCSDEQGQVLQKIFKEQIIPLAPDRFHLHLTPEYGNIVPGERYKFFNKPFGLSHWFEQGLRYKEHASDYDDTIFVILDPDEIVIRPFLQDYTHAKEIFYPLDRIHTAVEHGKPMAALYGLGAHYMKLVNLEEILGSAEAAAQSPTSKWTHSDVSHHYSAGPPYIATGRDMYRIVKTWREFVVPVYTQTNEHLAEMYAYSIAALHLNLPHQLVNSFMVSHSVMEQEGWPLIDKLDNVCAEDLNTDELPHVLHFCQRYGLGPWMFAKFALPTNFLSCHYPLLLLPNETEIRTMHLDYNYGYFPPGKMEPIKRPSVVAKRHAFMICQLTRKLNEAATYWKQHHCNGPDQVANYEHAIIFPHLMQGDVWKTLNKTKADWT
ncbi:hypothetical protein MPSEU_000446800 [Mayamaea pseudoterrestris]|nr:hypothetical protein MPSEU_000446800 [Mayamaea pseudoterrestris]